MLTSRELESLTPGVHQCKQLFLSLPLGLLGTAELRLAQQSWLFEQWGAGGWQAQGDCPLPKPQ